MRTVHPAPLPRTAAWYQSALLFSPIWLLKAIPVLLRRSTRDTRYPSPDVIGWLRAHSVVSLSPPSPFSPSDHVKPLKLVGHVNRKSPRSPLLAIASLRCRLRIMRRRHLRWMRSLLRFIARIHVSRQFSIGFWYAFYCHCRLRFEHRNKFWWYATGILTWDRDSCTMIRWNEMRGIICFLFVLQAAILQQTAEYIYQLEQEKTQLLSQNCQLKRLVNQHEGGDVPKKRKSDTQGKSSTSSFN